MINNEENTLTNYINENGDLIEIVETKKPYAKPK